MNQSASRRDLAGYLLEQPAVAVRPVTLWAIGIAVRITTAGQRTGLAVRGLSVLPLRLKPLVRLTPWRPVRPAQASPPALQPLRPLRSGRAYRTISPLICGLVRPELAEALETVFERFAVERGFTPEQPLQIGLARGFWAGSPGHGEGRAADITTVGGKSILEWKSEWDKALVAAAPHSDPKQRAKAITSERQRNLGWGLYNALQTYGGWRRAEQVWRPYRGVEQLFGPWTATEGPWKAMPSKAPSLCQRQRLADQQWVFRAHQDHIHVAR